MCDVICVTNQSLCRGDFLFRIEEIAKQHPAGILLREKDLNREEYKKLAKQVLEICKRYQVPCMLHYFTDVAVELKATSLHLPLPLLRKLSSEQKNCFQRLGASCHSLEEAREAVALGCTYIVAGHIFATDCKKGLPGRGLEFLRTICESVPVPVYAIGGMDSERAVLAYGAGAKGICVMSGLMQCEDVETYMAHYRK